MKKYLLSLILVLCIVTLVGCGKKNALVGKWEGKTNDGMLTTFEFKKDGKVDYNNKYNFSSTGTYKIDGKKVTIKLDSWDKEKVYEFSVKNKKLSLKATDKISPSYDDMIKK